MKKKFFVVAAMIIGSRLLAQDTTLLDEVVITANKYPNKTSLTGKVITVIDRQQLEQSGAKDLSQILAEQAGIYIGGANSNPGKDKSVYLRGARIDHTLITIDGVPVYDASGIGGNFDVRNLSVDNIERIEILKGSQSTLYGSDAIAGVINIITKKGGSKKINGSGIVSYGSNESFHFSPAISGKNEKIDYNVGYSFFNTKGINEAASNSTNADKDGFKQNSINASLGIQPTSTIRIQPYIRYTKLKGDLDQGAFTDEVDYTYTQKSLQAGVRNEVSAGKTKLNLLYNYNYINRLYIDDSTKSRNGFDIYSRGSYKGREHFIDAYATTSFCNELKLIAGADFRQSSSDQDFFSVGYYGPYNSHYAKDSLTQNQLALYAALNYNNRNGFNIEVGNRINIHSEYGSHDVWNINPSWLVNNKLKLFANFSSAYRTPSLYQLFSEYGNKKLKPEAAVTYEGGVQYYAFDKKMNARATFFKRNVDDVIFFYYNSSAFQSQYINQDKQRDHGLELEATFIPSKNISIKTFYSFVDGKIITKQNDKDTTYFNLLRRPKNSAGITFGWKMTKKLFVSSNFIFTGKRKDAWFDSQTFQTVAVTLGDYLLWNIYVENSFSNKKLKAFIDLRNITNSKYNEVAGFNTLRFNGYAGIRFSL